MEELTAWFVHPFVHMRAEEVALGLDEIGRETGVSIAVKIVQRCCHCRRPDAVQDGCGENTAPSLLGSMNLSPEERIEQQI
jgi:hypothetical protein